MLGNSYVALKGSDADRDFRAEAKQWASVLHDADARRCAEEAAELILRKGFELPSLTEVRLKKTRMGITAARYFEPASFKIGMGRIEVNTHPDVKKWAGGYEWKAEDGWGAQSNIILHEFGHMVDHYMEHLFPKSVKEQIHDRFDDIKEEDVKKILSKYGATQAVEFRAEVISAILAGKALPKEFLDAAYLNDYLSDERGKTIYQMGSGEIPNTSMVERQYGEMMEAVYHEDGPSLRIDILKDPAVSKFIDSHAQVLDNSFLYSEMSDTMRGRLRESDWVFSGYKTFHELNEAFPSLMDDNGQKKPFNQFLKDVQTINNTYNRNWLQAEFNFAGASAQMAAKWERFEEDGDDYYLQYRTANDGAVRPEHAALHGVTLPQSDSFWDTYYPPNGWNCRCTVVQVRKSKYEQTPHEEAMAKGLEALAKDTKGMFRFNPGKQKSAFPAYNPYTIGKCSTCDKSKLHLAANIPDNELCAACTIIGQCAADATKSRAAILRTHYLHEMEPLLKKKLTVEGNGHPISVGFTKYGNKHLYSDTMQRSGFKKEDLANLDILLSQSQFVKKGGLSKPRKDEIKRFYYYEVHHNGKTFYLNVAEEDDISAMGKINHHRYLYSITDRIK